MKELRAKLPEDNRHWNCKSQCDTPLRPYRFGPPRCSLREAVIELKTGDTFA